MSQNSHKDYGRPFTEDLRIDSVNFPGVHLLLINSCLEGGMEVIKHIIRLIRLD